MKKIILAILLISMLFIIVGCDNDTPNVDKISAEKYAMIIMPDGSLIQGKCNDFSSYKEITYITIEGIEYRAATWRVVIWAK